MGLAVELALRGRGATAPNPCVGAVLVSGGRVAATGWHTRYGMPHAERECLADARARGVDPRGATMYVTLEPPSAGLGKKFGSETPISFPALREATQKVWEERGWGAGEGERNLSQKVALPFPRPPETNKKGPLSRPFRWSFGYPVNRLKRTQALVPPNPKELDRAYSACCLRGPSTQ